MSLSEDINKYLTKQFISEDPSIPEDECEDEAREILLMVEAELSKLIGEQRDYYRSGNGVDEIPEMSTREVRDAFNNSIEVIHEAFE